MTEHTPGPWVITQGGPKTHPFAIESRHADRDGFDLAHCVHEHDAALIAAAPDMVRALRIGLYHTTLAADRAHGLARWSEQDCKHGTAAEFRRSAAESEAAADVLRAAIAKATGESK